MKTWKIPVVWQEMGTVVVEANTLAEAIEIARDDDGIIPIPDDGTFVDGSWEVDCEDENYLRKYYNNNQEDEDTNITKAQKEQLARSLYDKMIKLRKEGEKNIKVYEIAFQDVIEKVFPDKGWWEVTNCPIFWHLMEHKNPEATIIAIMKELKED